MTTTTPSAASKVGANVKAEMARAGITQQQVAAKLGASQTGVSKRILGRIPWDINELVEVAELLDVPLDRLLDGAA